ncbi:hypothetical protein GCM10026982_13240 [Nocardiopsis aegyptia]
MDRSGTSRGDVTLGRIVTNVCPSAGGLAFVMTWWVFGRMAEVGTSGVPGRGEGRAAAVLAAPVRNATAFGRAPTVRACPSWPHVAMGWTRRAWGVVCVLRLFVW